MISLPKDILSSSYFGCPTVRPWGYYISLSHISLSQTAEKSITLKTKLLFINPNSSLSLQMHSHRSEYWLVCSGTARVQRDDLIFNLTSGQSTFIPVRSVHRLSNIGQQELQVIEIQSGTIISEDDIVRFEDNYGRI